MRQLWDETKATASNDYDRTDSEEADTDQADSRCNQWFADVAQSLLKGVDCGFALSLLTGVNDRSCYRYAAGKRPPTGWLIRQLLRSDQGDIWLHGIMDGSNAIWWVRHQKAERIYSALAAELGIH